MMNTDVYDKLVNQAVQMYNTWQYVPAPVRGEYIRRFGEVLRLRKEEIATLITREIGKTINESRGEVQEAIDMCDFAVGLSRQLYGNTMPSERPDHRIQEVWHPLGPVGVITAFNFPVAVLAWNFCVAAVCGDVVVWKPSERAPKVADEVLSVWESVAGEYGNVLVVLPTHKFFGAMLSADERIPLISFTGSEQVGIQVASIVGARLGKTILELGGNNSAIVSDKADLDLAVMGCVFAALGTSGQRCTTLRRIFVHESIEKEFTERMVNAYRTIIPDDPFKETTLVGPVVDAACVNLALQVQREAFMQGATPLCGGRTWEHGGFHYIRPMIMSCKQPIRLMQEEHFIPLVYICPYSTLEVAVDMCNDVRQGLSSCIFSNDVNEIEYFLRNSYTGIVNINTSTSGAEIGGAFGGEKSTGGGRESGSDAWKQYMRRTTSVINYSKKLPLAQGVRFENLP